MTSRSRGRSPVPIRISTMSDAATTPMCWNSAGEANITSAASTRGRDERRSLPRSRPSDQLTCTRSGLSERYLVLAEFPLVVNPLWLKFSGKPFIRNYQWKPERGVRFHIVEKETGQVARTALSPAVFAFHHVNAFEEGEEVVVDIVAFPDSSVIDQLYLERLRSAEPLTATGKLTRFR